MQAGLREEVSNLVWTFQSVMSVTTLEVVGPGKMEPIND